MYSYCIKKESGEVKTNGVFVSLRPRALVAEGN